MNGVDSGKRKDERQRRRRVLEDELRVISEQKAAINRQLEALRGGPSRASVKPVQAAPPHKAGTKRPAALDFGVGEAPQVKRARIEAERSKRVNSLWQQCSTILKGLKKGKDAVHFCAPVDPVRLNCLDYFQIIKQPMDLGTVGKKLDDKGFRTYKTVYEFRDDVRLVFNNCRTYNAPGHIVRQCGEKLSEQWEKKWAQSGLEHKWEEEKRRQRAEDMEMEGGSQLAGPEVLGQMQKLAGDLAATNTRLDSAALPKPLIPGPHRNMLFEEKRKLSQKLSSLNDEQLAPVLQLVVETMGAVDDGDSEIELDLDQLPDQLLWKLHAHMQQLEAQQGRGGPVRRPPDKSRPGGSMAAGNMAAGAPQPMVVEQETSSRPAAAPSLQKANSSSSSSSGDSSSSDGSDDEEVEENGGSTLMDGRANAKAGGAMDGPMQHGGGGDVTTLVSATRPPATLKHKAGATGAVNVQNVNAWTNLAAHAAAPANKTEEGGAGNDADDLWKEFATKEEQQTAVAKAKQEAEAAQQKQREEELRARREAAEQQQRQQQEEQRQRQQQEEQRIQQAREEEARRLQELGAAADAGEENMPDLVHGLHANPGGNPLGLTMVHNSDDDDDESNDSDDSE